MYFMSFSPFSVRYPRLHHVVGASGRFSTSPEIIFNEKRSRRNIDFAPQGSASFRQVREVGGDCCDVLPLPDNRVALAIGDASGKSFPAALMISSVQSALRTADAQSPDNILSSIFASMDEFSNGHQTDDATVLIARVH
jgi:serine phosphatase RsbU (regulator of sigma subunit)